MDWPLIWFALGLPVTGALMVWGTFVIIHADEARSRKRRRELGKTTSTDG